MKRERKWDRERLNRGPCHVLLNAWWRQILTSVALCDRRTATTICRFLQTQRHDSFEEITSSLSFLSSITNSPFFHLPLSLSHSRCNFKREMFSSYHHIISFLSNVYLNCLLFSLGSSVWLPACSSVQFPPFLSRLSFFFFLFHSVCLSLLLHQKSGLSNNHASRDIILISFIFLIYFRPVSRINVIKPQVCFQQWRFYGGRVQKWPMPPSPNFGWPLSSPLPPFKFCSGKKSKQTN